MTCSGLPQSCKVHRTGLFHLESCSLKVSSQRIGHPSWPQQFFLLCQFLRSTHLASDTSSMSNSHHRLRGKHGNKYYEEANKCTSQCADSGVGSQYPSHPNSSGVGSEFDVYFSSSKSVDGIGLCNAVFYNFITQCLNCEVLTHTSKAFGVS